MAALQELDAALRALPGMKPPGISKKTIEFMQGFCVQNVQAESVIVPKIFTQFKNSSPTHKLGVLYIVDTVIRIWRTKAAESGQSLDGPRSPAGTFAAGVHRITEAFPWMMNEAIHVAPDTQKEKFLKLLDIWDKANTFPRDLVLHFKQRLTGGSSDTRSYTPAGSPSAEALSILGLRPQTSQAPVQQNPQPPAAPATAPAATSDSSDAGAILAALAGLNRPAPAAPASTPSNNFTPQAPAPAASQPYVQPQPVVPFVNPTPAVPTYGVAPVSQPIAGMYGMPAMPSQTLPQQYTAPSVPSTAAPQAPAAAPVNNNEMIMQLLAALPHLPPEQQQQVIAVLTQLYGNAANSAAAPQAAAPAPVPNVQPPAFTNVQPSSTQPEAPSQEQTYQNGQNGNSQNYDNNRRIPQRDRSRSPDFQSERGRSPPNRRGSPTYGVYNPNAAAESNEPRQQENKRGRGKNRGNRQDNYRQRTPPPQMQQQGSNQGSQPRQVPKNVGRDPTLPPGCIKVLSRTLFAGGVNGSDPELHQIFSRFGQVQSCIGNREKHHAFIKMADRAGAEAAKAGMENITDPAIARLIRSTRWGVGFGPRDCSDYNTGVSIIPIDRLTDADRKWICSAEYGGTGGRPLEPGLVVEEPDIEIGAGVSSKAISRRVPVDGGRGGAHAGRGGRGGFGGGGGRGGFEGGPHQQHHGGPGGHDGHGHGGGRGGGGGGGGGGKGKKGHHGHHGHGGHGGHGGHHGNQPSSAEEKAIGVPPPVPGFGFQLPGM